MDRNGWPPWIGMGGRHGSEWVAGISGIGSILELYRRKEISSGKAAELLGMQRFEFVRYASRLGIPFFDMSKEELERDLEALRKIYEQIK